MMRVIRVLLSVLVLLTVAESAAAQRIFHGKETLRVTLTTNLRDLTRQRDSTDLQWFGAEMQYTDDDGVEQRLPVELRARGHFRRQSSNCAFPPIFLRAEREVRDGGLLQGNPRVKIVTPCRPASGDYQQYILEEYRIYQAYEQVDSIHHRTRLAEITYVDSAGRMRPLSVTAFFLEIGDEVSDHFDLQRFESPGTTWHFIRPEVIDRLSLFQYMIGNTDWSVSGLHNIIILRDSAANYHPVAYDFDFAGIVNARYATPPPQLGIRSVRDRLHRGPCRTAEQWAPTIAYFQERRAAFDSIWTTPLPGENERRMADAKRYLDDFWRTLEDPRRFKREIIDVCRPDGN